MSSLEVKKYPLSILRKTCGPVRDFGQREKDLLDDMAELMYQSHGIGLAATQVGIDAQLAVVDIKDSLLKLVNPRILKKKGSDVIEEGCLSIPEVYVKVRRAKKILVEFMDENGSIKTLEAEGLLARAIQHELDHLNGRLIIDYLNPIKKFFIKKRLRK